MRQLGITIDIRWLRLVQKHISNTGWPLRMAPGLISKKWDNKTDKQLWMSAVMQNDDV